MAAASAATGPIPLHRKWTFLYENRATRATTPLGSFDTVQDFWSYYHVLPLKTPPPQSALAMFKAGVLPSAQDPANQEGGRWLLPEDADAAQAFTQLALALIGENFVDGDALTGLVLSTRLGNAQQVALWHSGALDSARLDVTLRELCKFVDLRADQVKHAPHREALAAALPQKSFGVRLNRSVGNSSEAHSQGSANSSRTNSPLPSPRTGSGLGSGLGSSSSSLLSPPIARASASSAASSPQPSPRQSPPSSPLRRSGAVEAVSPSESDEFLSPFHELTQLSPSSSSTSTSTSERRHKRHHTRPSKDRADPRAARLGPLAEETTGMGMGMGMGTTSGTALTVAESASPRSPKSSKHSRSFDAAGSAQGSEEAGALGTSGGGGTGGSGEYALPKRHRRRGRRPSQASDDFGSALHRRHQSSAALLARHARHGSRSMSESEDDEDEDEDEEDEDNKDKAQSRRERRARAQAQAQSHVLGIRPTYWLLLAALIVLLVLGTYYYAEHVVRPQWRAANKGAHHHSQQQQDAFDDSGNPFVDKPKRLL